MSWTKSVRSLIEAFQNADNGTHIEGFGYVVGMDRAWALREAANLFAAAMDAELPDDTQTFDVCIYEDRKPRIVDNATITSHHNDNGYHRLGITQNGEPILELVNVFRVEFTAAGIEIVGLQTTPDGLNICRIVAKARSTWQPDLK